MARNQMNLLLLVGLIGAVLLFACWMMVKRNDGNDKGGNTNSSGGDNDVQFIEGEYAPPFSNHTFEGADGGCDDPEFVETDPDTGMNAHQLSVGVGPGLYGSGRHTSELYGN